MDKKKKIYSAIAGVIVIIAAAAAVFCGIEGKQNSGNNEQNVQSATGTVVGEKNTTTDSKNETTANGESNKQGKQEDAEKEKVYKPTFKYFVSKSDEQYDEAMNVVEKLKSEYGNTVNFDIVDVDKNPDAKTNFAMVDGNTPFLIMLNTKNDLSAFEPKCSDFEKLKSDIENALK